MINPEIEEKIEHFGFDRGNIIIALLSLYYNLSPECITDDIKRQMNITGVVKRIYSLKGNSVVWNIPLFVDIEDNVEKDWEWVNDEFRAMFREVSIKAGGDKRSCVNKMKRFFQANKGITKEKVLDAARLYLNEFANGTQDIRYLQRADYFIFKSAPNSKEYQSRLSQYLEMLEDNPMSNIIKKSMRGLI